MVFVRDTLPAIDPRHLPTRAAPGVYEWPEEPIRRLTGERMDVAAFVGIAPRGPARERHGPWPWAVRQPTGWEVRRSVPVPVESWSDYRRHFGGFGGPGLLPYAVANFFAQGGRRAWVVRVVHEFDGPANEEGVALGCVMIESPHDPDPIPRAEDGVGYRKQLEEACADGRGLLLRARSEGSWGNRLSAALTYHARPIAHQQLRSGGFDIGTGVELPEGTVVRVTSRNGDRNLRLVGHVADQWSNDDSPIRWTRRATFDRPLPDPAAGAGSRDEDSLLEVVEAKLRVSYSGDPDSTAPAHIEEVHSHLGLDPAHPRWIARVLVTDSELVRPDDDLPQGPWVDPPLRLPGVELSVPTPEFPQFYHGVDRYSDVTHDDFFDDRWVPGDEGGDGVHSLLDIRELSLLCVPDLYSAGLLPHSEELEDPPGSPYFELCDPAPVPEQAQADVELSGLRLDPALPEERRKIVEQQQRLVKLAEERARHAPDGFIALLDVPPGLGHSEVTRWREQFDSAFAAAYHPWPLIDRVDDFRDGLIPVNPSAVAAGIIAAQERRFGVPHGPANVIAVDAIDVSATVSPGEHAELHPAGVNVFLKERDGIRLTAARTLSRSPEYRQLSVRRLVTMLARSLDRQLQWTVFEGNDARLRSQLKHMIRSLLRSLFQVGAFAGATENQSFFVRADSDLKPGPNFDDGRLWIEIGVAPAEPIEFLVLTLSRSSDTMHLAEA